MPSFFDDIRKQHPRLNNVTDSEILKDYAAQRGMDETLAADLLGYKDPSAGKSDFGRGLSKGWEQTKGLLNAASGGVRELFGDTKGREQDLLAAGRNFREAEQYTRDTDDVTNVKSFGDAIDFAQAGLGSLAPMILPSVFTGGVAGIAGGAARGIASRKVGELAAKEFAASVAKQGLSKSALATGERVAGEAAAKQALAQTAKYQTAAKVGGGYLGNYAQEFGEIYNGLAKEGRADEVGRALGYAAPAALLDTATEVLGIGAVTGKIGKSLLGGKGRLVRGSVGTGVGALTEGATEVAQTAIERAGKYESLTGDAANKDYLNAFALGAVGGGTIGGVTGAVRKGEPYDALKSADPKAAQTPALTAEQAGQLAAFEQTSLELKEANDLASAKAKADASAAQKAQQEAEKAAKAAGTAAGVPLVTPPNGQTVAPIVAGAPAAVTTPTNPGVSPSITPTTTDTQVAALNPQLDVEVRRNDEGNITRLDIAGSPQPFIGKVAQAKYDELVGRTGLFTTVVDALANNTVEGGDPLKVSLGTADSVVKGFTGAGVEDTTTPQDLFDVAKGLRDLNRSKSKNQNAQALADQYDKVMAHLGRTVPELQGAYEAASEEAAAAQAVNGTAPAAPANPVVEPITEFATTNEAAPVVESSAPVVEATKEVPINEVPILDNDIVGLALISDGKNPMGKINVRNFRILSAFKAGYSTEDIKKAFGVSDNTLNDVITPKRIGKMFKGIATDPKKMDVFLKQVEKVFPNKEDAAQAALDFLQGLDPSFNAGVPTEETAQTAQEVLSASVDEEGNPENKGFSVVESANANTNVVDVTDAAQTKVLENLEELNAIYPEIYKLEQRIQSLGEQNQTPAVAKMREVANSSLQELNARVAELTASSEKTTASVTKKLDVDRAKELTATEQQRRANEASSVTETKQEQPVVTENKPKVTPKVTAPKVTTSKVVAPAAPSRETRPEETNAEAVVRLVREGYKATFPQTTDQQLDALGFTLEKISKTVPRAFKNAVDFQGRNAFDANDALKLGSTFTETTKAREGLLESRGESLSLSEGVTLSEGIEDLVDNWIDLGIAKWLKAVQLELVDLEEGVNGEIEFVEGETPVVRIAFDALESPTRTRQTVAHEVAHAIDMAGHDGVYSSQPEMQVRVQDGQVRGTGAVARELINAYNNGTLDPRLQRFLQYPLNTKLYQLTPTLVQKELFAQLFHVATAHPKLLKSLPVTANFMQEVLNDVRSTEAVSSQTSRVAEQRADSFKARKQNSDGSSGGGGRNNVGGRQDSSRGKASPEGARLNSMGSVLQSTKSGSILADIFNSLLNKGVTTFTATSDLMSIAEKILPSVAQYREAVQAKAATRNVRAAKVQKIAAAFGQLPKATQTLVNSLIYEQTSSKRWAYRISANSTITLDPQLANRFNALPKEAQQVIRDVFAHGYAERKEMRIALEDVAMDNRDAAILAANGDVGLIDKAKTLFTENMDTIEETLGKDMKAPYAPLMRFGSHVVVAKSQDYLNAIRMGDAKLVRQLQADPDHYSVSFHESVFSRAAEKYELDKSGKFADVQAFAKDTTRAESFTGAAMGQAYENLRTLIRGDVSDPKAQVYLDQLAMNLYLSTVAETSARQANNRRVGVAGAEQNMMRSFLGRGLSTAALFANVKHNTQINDSLNTVKEEADTGSEGTRADRRDYQIELEKRHMVDVGEASTLTSALMRVSSFQNLATSPAYYLNNLTQVAMMTVPFLAGQHGYTKSWGSVLGAYKEVGRMMSGTGLTGDMDTSKASPRFQQALKQMVAEGWLEDSGLQDSGKLNFAGSGAVKEGLMRVDAKLAGIQQRMEAINRFTTALAAYELAIQSGKNFKTAMRMARETVDRTQFDYSDMNAPRMFRGEVGKVLLQFKKYSIYNGGLIARQFNDSFRSASPEERAVARAQLLYTVGHSALVAGAYGLPVPIFLVGAVQALTRGDDEPEDNEMRIRKWVDDPDLATLLTKGVPAYLGVDLSERLGSGQAFNPFQQTEFKFDTKTNTAKSILDAAGPTASNLGRVLGSWEKMKTDPIAAVGEVLLPNGVKNLIKAGEYSTEGLKNKKGDVLITAEDITGLEVFLKGIGYNPTKVAIRQIKEESLRNAESYYKSREAEITDKYVDALGGDGSQDPQKFIDEFFELQQEKVRNGFKFTPAKGMITSDLAQAKRERNTLDGVQFNKNNRGYVESMR